LANKATGEVFIGKEQKRELMRETGFANDPFIVGAGK
jgi:hypothetical protein